MTNEQNDWRALCVELITAIRRHADCMTLDDEVHDVLDRIRAALAQPEPKFAFTNLAARPLLEKVAHMADCIGQQTVAEIAAISSQAAAWLRENPPGQPVAIEPRGCPTPGACSCVEPTALAHPEPEGVTDEELLRLACEKLGYEYTPALLNCPVEGIGCLEALPEELVAFARHALIRWGRPTIKPVPVSERLPEAEDCDAEGRCWWLTLAVAEGGRGGYSTFWELTTFKAAVRCASHWLPHHALPVPAAERLPVPEGYSEGPLSEFSDGGMPLG
jgi:hypothetical protein